jgi:hypothetical protein
MKANLFQLEKDAGDAVRALHDYPQQLLVGELRQERCVTSSQSQDFFPINPNESNDRPRHVRSGAISLRLSRKKAAPAAPGGPVRVVAPHALIVHLRNSVPRLGLLA